MKKFSVLFAFSLVLFAMNTIAQVPANYSPEEVLLMFKKSATQQDINDLLDNFNATELEMTSNLRVRKWRLGPFPMTTDDGIYLENIIDAVGVILGQPDLDGGGLNYDIKSTPLSTISAPSSTDYNPLDGCEDYPGQIYGTTGTRTVKVAIIDSGIDMVNHNDLFSPYFTGGYNFIDENSDLTDNNGHGTRVAGILAGIFQTAGLSNAQIKMYKSLGGDGNGNLYDCMQALDQCIEDNVHIVNLSWGFFPDPDDEEFPFIGKVIRKLAKRGILVVSSAGNDNIDLSNENYFPASFSEASDMAAVAAVDCGPDGDQTGFTNFGGEVAFVAPGDNILCPDAGGNWVYASGTSYAAPFACGVAAQIGSTLNNLSPNVLLGELKSRYVSVTADVLLGGISMDNNSIGNLQSVPNNNISYESSLSEQDEISIQPNPFQESIQVQYNTEIVEDAQVLIANTLGQVVWQQNVSLEKGLNQWSFSPSLAAGSYYLILKTNNRSITVPVVRIR